MAIIASPARRTCRASSRRWRRSAPLLRPEDRREPGAVVGMGEAQPELPLDAIVAHALAVPIKAQRHRAEPGFGEGHERRRCDAQQPGRICHDLGGRGRVIVGEVVDGAGARLGHRSLQRRGNVLDMDPAEDLARLVDALGPALPQGIEGGPAGSVDAGESEDVDGHAAPGQRPPAGFGRDPTPAALAGGRELALLVHPAAGAVAIDPGGGQIAGPGEPSRGRDISGMEVEDRVALGIGRDRAQKMGRAGEGRLGQRPATLEEEGLDAPLRHSGLGALLPAGAGYGPAAGLEAPGEGEGAIAEAETEQAHGDPASNCARTVESMHPSVHYPCHLEGANMRDRCVILSRSRRRALAGGLTAVLLMLGAPVLAENPPAAALQPSHSAEADQAKQYADCMSAARATPAQGLTTAQLWAQKGGGTPAGHCAAVALIGLGRYEEAASSMEKLAGQEMKGRKDLAASLYDQAAQAWVLANDNAKAVKDVGAAIALAPQDPELLIDRGVILASMGRYRESVDDLSKAHDLAGSRADILVLRATAYSMIKTFDLARADIDQ